MSNAPLSDVEALLDKTERNMKVFEDIKGEFPAPVLNEWRYATRHAVSLAKDPADEAQRLRVASHLQRAYFDSCDVLLVAVLSEVDRMLLPFVDYSEIVLRHVPGYRDKRVALLDARRRHLKCRSFSPEGKREQYDALEASLGPILALHQELVAALPEMRGELRRVKNEERRRDAASLRNAVSTAVGIGGLLVAVLTLLLKRG